MVDSLLFEFAAAMVDTGESKILTSAGAIMIWVCTPLASLMLSRTHVSPLSSAAGGVRLDWRVLSRRGTPARMSQRRAGDSTSTCVQTRSWPR